MASFLDAGRSGGYSARAHDLRPLLWSKPYPRHTTGFPLIQYLSLAGLLVLVFTTMWSYRYTKLAARIADPERRPEWATFQGTVWTGIKASTVGILFSMIVMFFEVGQLLIYFLCAPGGNSGCSDDERRSGKLGIRSRHRGAYGPSPHHVRRGCRPCLQPLALYRTTTPSVEFPYASGRISDP